MEFFDKYWQITQTLMDYVAEKYPEKVLGFWGLTPYGNDYKFYFRLLAPSNTEDNIAASVLLSELDLEL